MRSEATKHFLSGLLIALATFAPASAKADSDTNEIKKTTMELKRLSLEELANIDVISVSRRPEPLAETPSAIEVVTSEDIKRSGASSLPEALRLAPNLEVAQVNSHDWSISSRGFNNTLANKLLVMIDGRTVYTPLFAGVFWDMQNVMLEDVDRIEVVSGPGGTLWGANAVDGVINVVTKSSRDTQGTYVSGGGGSLLQDFGEVRYGGQISSNVFFRVFGGRFDQTSTELSSGVSANDSWDMTQGGFRMDWYATEADTVMAQANFYGGNEGNFNTNDTTVDGQNVMGRWSHTFSEDSDCQIQAYYDRASRNVPGSYQDELETYDVDFQHRFPIGERNSVLWGSGYRLAQDRFGSGAIGLLPADRDLQLFSGFLQDEITVIPDELKFTLGTKVEHNDYSGWEIQPSGRVGWTFAENQFLWAAVSRAVRSPSRIDSDVQLTTATLALTGDPDFQSEELAAYELGYRAQLSKRVSVSLSGYYDEYNHLRSLDLTSLTTAVIANDFEGEVWGVEMSSTLQAMDQWRLRLGLNYINKDLRPTSPTAIPSVREGDDPEYQVFLQSTIDLPAHFQLDTTARAVGALAQVPAYFTFDVRLAWQYKNMEIAVVGQNLFDQDHPEFGAPPNQSEIPRSVFGKITFRF